jgi:hypothetical protein
MGSLCSRCLRLCPGAGHHGSGRNANDHLTFLDEQGLGGDDLAFCVASTPAPLLKDVDFAVVEDSASDDPSGSSGENAAIDRMVDDADA